MDYIDHYKLEKRLGAGAFATVWLGHDARLDGKVAIKVLADNWVGEPDVVRRFLDEARLLWKAEHPRIIRVYTVGELPSGQPYFVMEYADRGTLGDRLAEGLIPADQAAGLCAEIGRCVDAVHELGAIHRDVKPANFLIRSRTRPSKETIPGLAPDERLLIADLGLAKDLAVSSGFTVAAGSPDYMAPEQSLPSAALDASVDTFALGVTCYEVFAGQPPLKRRSIAAATSFDPSQIVPLSQIRGDVGPELDAVLQRAMQADPAHRYPDVDSFLADFTAAARTAAAPAGHTVDSMSDLPVSTPPQPPPTAPPDAAAPPAPDHPASALPAAVAPTTEPQPKPFISDPDLAVSDRAGVASIPPEQQAAGGITSVRTKEKSNGSKLWILAAVGAIAAVALAIVFITSRGDTNPNTDDGGGIATTADPTATAAADNPNPAPPPATDSSATALTLADIPDWYEIPANVTIDEVFAEATIAFGGDEAIVAGGTYTGDVEPLCDDFAVQATAAGYRPEPPLLCSDGLAVVQAFRPSDEGDTVGASLGLTSGTFVLTFPPAIN